MRLLEHLLALVAELGLLRLILLAGRLGFRFGLLGLGTRLIDLGLALFDDAPDRAIQEPRQQPDQDEEVDGLEGERPPVDGHFSGFSG